MTALELRYAVVGYPPSVVHAAFEAGGAVAQGEGVIFKGEGRSKRRSGGARGGAR